MATKKAGVKKAAARKPASRAKAAAAKDYELPSFMTETNGGGSPEDVPGFDCFRAATAGFDTRRLAGPTILVSRPDGGFFSESLPKAVVSSGAPAGKAENVIGVDNRVHVNETAGVPWRCICHLEVEYESGPVGFGTGFFVGPHALVTAAHVLIDRQSYGWKRPRPAKRIRVIPGRNGTLAPYGYLVCTDYEVSKDWSKSKNANDAARYDFGVIRVPKDETVEGLSFGERIGYFGLKAFKEEQRAEMRLLFINCGGYPYEADKPYGTLWYNGGRIGNVNESFVEYLVDTEGGQSGSPIYYYDKQADQRYVVAIHTIGDFVNRGLRITKSVFEQIQTWAER